MSESPPRVVILVQNMPVPLDRRVWQECLSLRDAGYDVDVVAPRGPGQTRHQVLERVRIHTYAPPPPTTGLLSYLVEFIYCWIRTLALVAGVRRRGRIDVIQACNPPDTYFALALLFRALGTKFVYDQHDLCPEVYSSRFGSESRRWIVRVLLWLELATYRTADHVIVTNDSYRSVALTRGSLDPSDVTVVRSAPDAARMRPGAPRPELRRGREHLCCWLGIMGPQDGVDLLLESIRIFVHELHRDDVHFAVLGYGDCLEQARALTVEYGLSEFVELPGRVDADQIGEYLSTADVGLSSDPLNPLNEVSTMNKTLEYMAFGLPVVAYRLKETVVSAGDAAVYVEPDDARAFAVAVADLVDHPGCRAALGAAGRRRIEEVMSWDHQRDAYVAAFDRLIGRSSRGSVDGTSGPNVLLRPERQG